MFDRLDYPARGRRGGGPGAPTTIAQDDGTPMKGKGKQFVPHGRRVVMAFPSGAGYGPSTERSVDLVKRDLALGYISARTAERAHGLGQAEIDDVLTRTQRGETF